MKTPICDFVNKYAESNAARLHMPGHKGVRILGCESLDITEISGADELFAPDGIIAESEKNAGSLFGADTFYSTGGSTLCIQVMLYLIAADFRKRGREQTNISESAAENSTRPLILAGRNAHKAFINAAALLGIRPMWLSPTAGGTYHSCIITPTEIRAALEACPCRPAAVYVTSPDYLGNTLDISGIARECHAFGVPLAVDNAHGAYLKFLPRDGQNAADTASCPLHPIEAGADICCDSAHKTLPVLTGGAYLHISHNAPQGMARGAKAAFSVFGSSSPSYLTLQSLDAFNAAAADFCSGLSEFLPRAEKLRQELSTHGFDVLKTEPLKITLCAKSFGYTGAELAQRLERQGIFPEFFDPDFIVFMLSPMLPAAHFERLSRALLAIEKKRARTERPPQIPFPVAVLSPREAVLRPFEVLPIERCLGRTCSVSTVGCPPAIPPVMPGEIITQQVLDCLRYYGVGECRVVAEE